jgi:hypothetical protein
MNVKHRLLKYIFLVATCILMLGLFFPGCGGGEPEKTETTAPEISAPEMSEPTGPADEILVIPPLPKIPDIPEGTTHSWKAAYTEIYFNDFESSVLPGLELSNGAEVTGDSIDGEKSVVVSNWGSIETVPDELPLSPDTYYLFEFDYQILDRGTVDHLLENCFFPAGSYNEQDQMHCLTMLSNAETSGTFSSGGLTTTNADAYYLKIQATEGASIVVDNFRIYRQDNMPITTPPDMWAELDNLPYPRLGNYQAGNTNHWAMDGGGVVPDWPQGKPVYEAGKLEEKLAFFDVVAGIFIDTQTQDTAFVKRLRELNPDIVILPYRISFEQGTDQPRPPHATTSPFFDFFDGLADDWLATDTQGNQALDADAPYILKMNFSEYCPVVNGQTYTDYLVDWVVYNVMSSGVWDGIFFDNLFARINPHIENYRNPGLFNYDINRNGERDETSAEVSEIARAATLELLQMLRARLGDNALIMGNDGFNPDLCIAPYVNGFTFETWMDPWFGLGNDLPQPNEAAWVRSLMDYFTAQETTLSPHITILEAGGHEGEMTFVGDVNRNYLEHTRLDLERNRLGLGTALLGDGFYEYDLYDMRSAPYWFDEYSVNNEGVAVEDMQYKGYLGMPLADAVEMASPATLIWEEDFEGGSVPAGMEADNGVYVSDGALVIDNPDHTTYRQQVSVSTIAGEIPSRKGETYVVEFDWQVLETLDDSFSVVVNGSEGFLGSYELPEVIAGESGSVHFPVTMSYGSDISLIFSLRSGGGKVAIDNIKVYEGGAGPWRRDFENGFVLVNPLNKAYTFSVEELAGEFDRTGIRRILGTQATDVNNGQPVDGTLTLQPFDAIILLADHSPNS